jgi:electron transport complex protein RnfE
MSTGKLRNTVIDGLWSNNPDFARLLGLCPLLIASDSTPHALMLGVTTLMMLLISGPLLSLLRRRTSSNNHLPGFVMLIAALATCLALWLQAYAFAPYQQLALFIPLIITNCLIPAHDNQTPQAAMLDGLLTGLGLLLVLLVVGTLRGFLGSTLPLALLPPGALLLLGFLIALKNLGDTRSTESSSGDTVMPGSKRVRVTGKI